MAKENCYDVIIIGAGAAGLMCAIQAAKRSRRVLIIERSNKPGKKILMSGGGRCNFTNLNIRPECYLSQNPHFCKSALSRYTQWDFIDWVKFHQIPFHEKKLGQLFCDEKAKAILNMLLQECSAQGVDIHLDESVTNVEHLSSHFSITSSSQTYSTESLVVATGGLSIPTLGSTGFGYQIAEQFSLRVLPTRAGLVPFVFSKDDGARWGDMAGLSNPASVQCSKKTFQENILVTHHGLSGPAILQISSYWSGEEPVVIDLAPTLSLFDVLKNAQQKQPNSQLKTILSPHMSKRLIPAILGQETSSRMMQSFSFHDLTKIAEHFHQWTIHPAGTEGYRTAEVTLGGVDCHELSSKTMEAQKVPGLYFIGEVVDVTGWLGGYNFQWAWSSGWAAGQVV